MTTTTTLRPLSERIKNLKLVDDDDGFLTDEDKARLNRENIERMRKKERDSNHDYLEAFRNEQREKTFLTKQVKEIKKEKEIEKPMETIESTIPAKPKNTSPMSLHKYYVKNKELILADFKVMGKKATMHKWGIQAHAWETLTGTKVRKPTTKPLVSETKAPKAETRPPATNQPPPFEKKEATKIVYAVPVTLYLSPRAITALVRMGTTALVQQQIDIILERAIQEQGFEIKPLNPNGIETSALGA